MSAALSPDRHDGGRAMADGGGAVGTGVALTAAAVLFAVTHMQDLVDVAAPIALAVVALVGLGRMSLPRRIAAEVPLFAILGAYLLAVSIANDSLANLSPVEFIARHGKIFYIVVLFIIFYLFKPGCAIERAAFRGAIVMAVILSVLSLFSYFVSPIRWETIKFTNQNAIQGLFGGKNPMAGSMGALLVLLLLSYVNRGNRFAPIHRPALIALAGLLVAVAFLFAKSRGYALGVFGAFGWLAARTMLADWTTGRLSRRTLAYALVCVGFVGAVLALGGDRYQDAFQDDPNVSTRFELWERAARMFAMSPVLGLGLGSFQAVNTTIETVVPGLLAFKAGGSYRSGHIEHDVEGGMHVHNVYLQMLVDGGLIGVGLFFAILVMILRRAVLVRRMRGGPESDVLAMARFNAALTVAMFIYLAISGVTAGFTFTSPTMSWVFFLAGARLIRQHQHLAALARKAAASMPTPIGAGAPPRAAGSGDLRGASGGRP